MVKKTIKVRLGKKDTLIKKWWNQVSSNKGINISHSIVYAITIYAKTGDYPLIATIKDIDIDTSEDMLRKVFMSETSDAYKWLEECHRNGEAFSAAIKRVIRNSVVISNNQSIKTEDQLIQLLNSAINPVTLNNSSIQQQVINHKTIDTNENKIGDNNENVDNIVSKNFFSRDDDDEEFDIIQKLVGENVIKL